MLSMFRLTLIRYVLASGLALAVDMSTVLLALRSGVNPVGAAAVGYVVGLAAHWFMSSRVVFAGRLAERGLLRIQQQGLFIGSALVGLSITMAVVGIGIMLGVEPRIAKLIAVGISFQVTYLLRRTIVFS
jgi:putative flippase GtrA